MRRVIGLAAITVIALAGCGSAPAEVATPEPTPEEQVLAQTELPGGGRAIFPDRMLVAAYGHPTTPALGVLGENGLDAAVEKVRELAAQYEPLSDAPVVPAFEIIATVAHVEAGGDGNYSGETDPEVIRPWIERAGAEGIYVILDLQPGRSGLLEQARLYEDLLRHPHVGLAVDPEWKLRPDQVPLVEVGTVDADEINEVGEWLNALTVDADLPQKLMIVHQFQTRMVSGMDRVVYTRPGVQVLVQMDGQGNPGDKDHTWAAVRDELPAGVPMGFKNFYKVDTPMMGPGQAMAREPRPVLISYE